MVACQMLPWPGKFLVGSVSILETGGVFAPHPLLRLPDKCPELLNVGLSNCDEGWKSEDPKISAQSLPLYFLILPGTNYGPLHLSNYSLVHLLCLRRELAWLWLFGVFISPWDSREIVYSLGGDGEAGKRIHRKQISNVRYILPFRDSSYLW